MAFCIKFIRNWNNIIVSIPLSFTNYLITAVILALLHIIITYFVNRYIYNNQAKLFDKVS